MPDKPYNLIPPKPPVSNLLTCNEQIELLEEYSDWLTKNGYIDADWKDEHPYAIDEFLKKN